MKQENFSKDFEYHCNGIAMDDHRCFRIFLGAFSTVHPPGRTMFLYSVPHKFYFLIKYLVRKWKDKMN
jgi:hypothetical protein